MSVSVSVSVSYSSNHSTEWMAGVPFHRHTCNIANKYITHYDEPASYYLVVVIFQDQIKPSEMAFFCLFVFLFFFHFCETEIYCFFLFKKRSTDVAIIIAWHHRNQMMMTHEMKLVCMCVWCMSFREFFHFKKKRICRKNFWNQTWKQTPIPSPSWLIVTSITFYRTYRTNWWKVFLFCLIV